MEKQHLFTTQSLTCNNPTSFGMEMQSSNDFNPGFLIPNWDNPVDQNDPFESALSSIVSSPIHGFGNDHRSVNNDAAGSMITELLGKLRDVNTNVATSCYSSNTTPLNSPPKKNLSMFDVSNNRLNPVCSSGPEFAERVARFSSYGTGLHPQFMSKNMVSGVNGGDSTKVNVGSGVKNAEFGDPKEVSSISEQIPSRDLNIRGSNNTNNDANSRKRKSVSKGKAMENQASSVSNSEAKNVESGEKRSKIDEAKDEQKGNKKQIKEDSKPEPPKDYIHVRARRGQATDSHSLAERVRREKIGERMKFLQDLVPGCNKVTGKAVMLDEIINYVQSLQRQVEFLSMKLATVNPRLDFNVEALLSKAFHHPGSIQNTPFSLDLGMPAFPFSFQALQQGLPSQNCASSNVETQFSMNPLSSAAEPSQTMQFPLLGAFGDSACQVPALFEDDLHNVVQMGISQNQQQSFQDSVYPTEMKIEQ